MKEITPSPLVMLAQTCSRIGGEGSSAHGKVQDMEQSSVASTLISAVPASTASSAQQQSSTPTTAGTVVAINANSVASTAPNNTFTLSQDGNTVSVIPNVTLLPHMQSVNIGGQEALFIPAQNTSETATTTTPLQIGGHSMKPLQLAGQSAIPIQPLAQGNPIVVQPNGQTVQQVPSFIQIPVSTANGQTIYQTIQIGTVPIPVNATPVSILPTATTSTQQSEGIIAAALADSQVQLKPTKKAQTQPARTVNAGGDVTVQATQLVQTPSGYMLMPLSNNESGDSPSKIISNSVVASGLPVSVSSGKQPDYATLVSVESISQNNSVVTQVAGNQVRYYTIPVSNYDIYICCLCFKSI